MMQRYFLIIGLFLLLLVSTWFYLRLADPDQVPVSVQVLSCADITKECGNQGLRIRFDSYPKVMKPFNVFVEVPDATAVQASFAMQGMEMGLNRYRFIQKSDTVWQAEVTLPICMRGRADWMVDIEVKGSPGNTGRYQIGFTAN